MEGWPHRLQARGHRVVSIGKLHYRDASVPAGFDKQIEAMNMLDGVGDVYGLLREVMPPKSACRRLADELGRGDCNYLRYDRRITEHACAWLEEAGRRRGESPWALLVSFASPHYPLIAPPEFYYLYDEAAVYVPPAVTPDDPSLHP